MTPYQFGVKMAGYPIVPAQRGGSVRGNAIGGLADIFKKQPQTQPPRSMFGR